jgi:hypothetical protein
VTFLPALRYRADRFAPLGLFALLGLVILQGLVVSWARSSGFHAVSDDDYARVVIAQKFVESPSWDPSGTSWLPFPFLHLGITMKLFSASLEVARTAALFSACTGTLLLYAASRSLGTGAVLSFAAAAAGALLPTSVFLSAATVPEYLTSALIVFGVTSLARREPDTGRALLGGLCLFLACASRYEAWPAACAASGVFFFRFFWGARSAFSLGAAGLCLLFPVVWLLHGVASHQEALFFIKRVTDYKNALGGSSSNQEAALLYLRALLLSEPEVAFALLSTLAFTFARRSQKCERPLWLLPFLPLFVMLLTLVVGALRSGAPTHHEERALLSIWLLAALTTARLLEEVRRSLPRVLLALVVGLSLGGSLRAAGAFEKQPFTDRAAEERLGKRLATLTSPTEKIALALSDYGYFAVMAAAQHPGRFTILVTHDPRETEQTSASSLKRYEANHGCFYVTMSDAPLGDGHFELERRERWSIRQTASCEKSAANDPMRP